MSAESTAVPIICCKCGRRIPVGESWSVIGGENYCQLCSTPNITFACTGCVEKDQRIDALERDRDGLRAGKAIVERALAARVEECEGLRQRAERAEVDLKSWIETADQTMKRAVQAERQLAEAQERRRETVAMCEQLQGELAEARELASQRGARLTEIHKALHSVDPLAAIKSLQEREVRLREAAFEVETARANHVGSISMHLRVALLNLRQALTGEAGELDRHAPSCAKWGTHPAWGVWTPSAACTCGAVDSSKAREAG